MHDEDLDRRWLRCLAHCFRVDESHAICPDIDRIAAMDGDIESKTDVFTTRLEANWRGHARAA